MREPGAGYVRVKVQACGVCHSDALTKDGLLARNRLSSFARSRDRGRYRRRSEKAPSPGKSAIGWESAGTADTAARCDSCRRGDFITCVKLQIPGISYDGGYSELCLCRLKRWPVFPTR